MGWADDMYEAGYTSEHGGLMGDGWNEDESSSRSFKREKNLQGNNNGKLWTDSARYEVAVLYGKGVSVESIAEEFQRTPYAIAWQLFNLNKLTNDQKESFK